MIKSVRLKGERRGYDAAWEAVEDVLPEQFDSEGEFLNTFFDMALEYEDSTRELDGFDPAEDESDEDPDEIWESYTIGVRLGIKRRWQEVMGMFSEEA